MLPKKTELLWFKFLYHICFLSYFVVFNFGEKSTRVWAQDWVSDDLFYFLALLHISYLSSTVLFLPHLRMDPLKVYCDTSNTAEAKPMVQKNCVLPKLLKWNKKKLCYLSQMHHQKVWAITKNQTFKNGVFYTEESHNSLLMSCFCNSNSVWNVFYIKDA